MAEQELLLNILKKSEEGREIPIQWQIPSSRSYTFTTQETGINSPMNDDTDNIDQYYEIDPTTEIDSIIQESKVAYRMGEFETDHLIQDGELQYDQEAVVEPTTIGYPFIYDGEVCIALTPNFELWLRGIRGLLNGIECQRRYCGLYERDDIKTEITPLVFEIYREMPKFLQKKLKTVWLASYFIEAYNLEAEGIKVDDIEANYLYCLFGFETIYLDYHSHTSLFSYYSKTKDYLSFHAHNMICPVIHIPNNATIVKTNGEAYQLIIPKGSKVSRHIFPQDEGILIANGYWRPGDPVSYKNTCTEGEFVSFLKKAASKKVCHYEGVVQLFEKFPW